MVSGYGQKVWFTTFETNHITLPDEFVQRALQFGVPRLPQMRPDDSGSCCTGSASRQCAQRIGFAPGPFWCWGCSASMLVLNSVNLAFASTFWVRQRNVTASRWLFRVQRPSP